MVYLYISCGNRMEEAEQTLKMGQGRLNCAVATLRQLGLWEEPKKLVIPTGERPNYTENDVFEAMDQDFDFRILYGEVQRLLGKSLNTEELKILLGFTRYLGFTPDVISVLVNYCRDRQRQKGITRAPSLRMIEKEAYEWAEKGIDSLEEAAAYIQNQNQYNIRMAISSICFRFGAVGSPPPRSGTHTSGPRWGSMTRRSSWPMSGPASTPAV